MSPAAAPSPVVAIATCAVCGGERISTLLTRSIAQFLGSRIDHYDLASLGLTGAEMLGYARCAGCGFIFATPTLDRGLEHATYNAAKADGRGRDSLDDPDVRALYETYHKWVDLQPFALALGFHAARFRTARNQGGRRIRLLDIGCGYGHTLELARVFGLDGRGCDLDESRLLACRAKGLTVSRPEDVTGTYDIVVSSNVIEHVFDVHEYMGMVARVLDATGVFVFNGLEKSVIRVELGKPAFKLLHPIEHRNVFTRGSLKYLLERHGLRLVRRSEALSVARATRSRGPLYLPQILAGGFVALNGVFSAVARRV